jgi:hypothetical protein
MGAPLGNTNKADGRRWAGAIRRALHEYTDDRVKQGEALHVIACDLVRDALHGDATARREIGDRMDGKPAQAVTVAGDDEGGPIRHSLTVGYADPPPTET